ncbi:MAG: fused MFS/spermidine synthase [Betaproteobacteria bacterium]|nr:fused MFS/spermidine synthase [Betaproteobacteria bacterium]
MIPTSQPKLRADFGVFLLLIFIASGFAGLIYQSIWAQYLGLILGHSAYAQTLVLALFMGGMALGAWLVSRKSALLKSPLKAYAAVELIIGFFGVGFHGYYLWISGFSYETLFPALEVGPTLELGRWSVASLLILPQCVLLGMTFPLMSAGYLRWRPEAGGRVLAGLYFANSLGAAVGVLCATYWLLPAVGLPGTVLTAGLINVLVAIAVWPLSKHEQQQSVEADKTGDETVREQPSVPALILWAAAITGATSFVYEISWVRMLAMTLGSTIHAFELMLSAFIAGIACGGWWLRGRADRLKSARAAAGWAQILMGIAALSTLFLYSHSFEWVAWLMNTLDTASDSAYTVYNFASAAISMVIMFPAAFFAGMTLPLFTLILLRQGAGEAAIGRIYAANTLGAIVGVALAVYIGLPVLGLRVSLWGAAAADIVLGLVLLLGVWRAANANNNIAGGTQRPRWATHAVLAAMFVVLAVPLLWSHFDPLLMSSGVFRHGRLPNSATDQILFYRDGRTASVALRETARTSQRSIITNGKPDAGVIMDSRQPAGTDEVTMVSLGVLPMLYQPNAKTAGVIGFGSGMSTHFLLGNPAIESVDTIEIEPSMIEAARFFAPQVRRPFEDPRSHLVIDDAKSYFSTSRKKYDIILSEPSNPWVNGVASLFTEEFYRFVPRHLNSDGVFVQWLHTYEITPELVASVLNAMLPYFADVQAFQGSNGDWVLVASPQHPLPPVTELDIPSGWPQEMRAEMARRGLRDRNDFIFAYLGNKTLLHAFARAYGKTAPNSDFYPVLQLRAPKARFQKKQVGAFMEMKMAPWPILETASAWRPPSAWNDAPRASNELASLYVDAFEQAKKLKTRLTQNPIKTADGLDFISTLTIDQIWQMGRRCDRDTSRDWLFSLTNLAAQTIPYMPPKALENVWVAPRWLNCTPADPFTRDYLHFLAASAMRDHDAILKIGESLFAAPESPLMSTHKQIGAYILGAMELAAYARGEPDRASALEAAHGAAVGQGGERIFISHLVRSAAQQAQMRNPTPAVPEERK